MPTGTQIEFHSFGGTDIKLTNRKVGGMFENVSDYIELCDVLSH